MVAGKFKENIKLLSKLDLKRARNMYQTFKVYRSGNPAKTGLHPGYPISLSVEPTTSCNLRCPECPSGLRAFSRNTGMLDLDLFQNILDQLSPTLLYLNLYFQGEPLLHPKFFELVRMAKRKKIFTNTSTNAHFLKEENSKALVGSGLDRLIISLDGITPETYRNYRVGGQLDKVLEGTKTLVEAKRLSSSKTPLIFFQFLVSRQNEHEIPEARKLAKEMGVDGILFKSMQVMDLDRESRFLPKNPVYSRYESNGKGGLKLKGMFENECWRMWSGAVITWDGLVVPCCFDKDATHQMGDLKVDPFSRIWNGQKYRDFRKAIFTDRSQIEMCKNCSEGAKVWLDPNE